MDIVLKLILGKNDHNTETGLFVQQHITGSSLNSFSY